MNASLAFPIVMVVIAGAAVATQPAFNAQLAAVLGSPLRAALVNFSAGALVMLGVVSVFVLRNGLPSRETLASVPPHLWIAGGALGALFVTTAMWATPKIGVGAFFAVLIAAQLIAALAMDHFGLLGLDVRPANLVRIGGVLLLVAGAIMVVRG
ncbi:membrane protein [Glycocaulis albus]|jgi:transporter family-2 protein|uniref:Membrane protein n=1 Tax=Glycocaulis albus TaxID=1382801 RepID=A0ABQ1XBR1_9PROT|nr:DMT family transporter [Glycocaulis albus]GGG89436.1 membrane protein [Glycocaulis albus]